MLRSTLITLLCSFYVLFSNAQSEENKVFLNNESSINSNKLEYSPAFYEDGIVFISSRASSKKYRIKDTRIDKNIMSIYLARRSEAGLLQNPEPFSEELLSTVHEGPITFDRTADNIFFTRNNIVKGRPKKAKDGIVKLKIYTASKVGDKWSNIKDMKFNDNDFNTAHPAISVEGNVLYFSSDRPGGMGGMDIWKVNRTGDDWSAPENLGPNINTDSDEIFPFIHADGSLYFASGGHSGFGGLDLYSSAFSNNSFSKVVNLGKPFNTENDDFGFIIDRDKKNGYFSSNRAGGIGDDDIYSFYLSNNLDQVTGAPTRPIGNRDIEIAVIDDETGEPIQGAKINYILVDELTLAKALLDSEGNEVDPNTNELLLKLPFGSDASIGNTDPEGVFPTSVKYSNYIFNIEKPGYQARQVILTSDSEVNQFLITLSKAIPGSDGLVNNNNTGTNNSNNGTNNSGSIGNNSSNSNSGPIVLGQDGNSGIDLGTTIREGSVIELPNIYYNFNDSGIRPDARKDLDVVVGLLNRYPDMQIELSSHTDSRGSSRYNRNLSQTRAENAVAYLSRQGISASRLRAVGYGESELRNECNDGVNCSEFDHQYNRRTEVRVTRMSREINVTFVNDSSAPETIDAAPEQVINSTRPSSSTISSSSSNSSGDFVGSSSGSVQVIVGVFSEEKNAQKRLNQVKSLGFDLAAIEAKAGKNVVIAGRYASSSEAESAASFLKANSVKTYVKR